MPIQATLDDAKEIHGLFRLYKDIFPPLRFDYVQRKIRKGNCIYDNDVVITYTIYKRKNKIGTHSSNLPLTAEKGDVWIHQVANRTPSNGMSNKVMMDFLNGTVKDRRVYLSVGKNNSRAIRFYEKIGFVIYGVKIVMGKESWVMGYNKDV